MRADEKLATVLKRQGQIKAAVQAAREERKAIAEREQERLIRIVGGALLAHAAHSPDFELILKGVLQNAPLSDSDRRFLQRRNRI